MKRLRVTQSLSGRAALGCGFGNGSGSEVYSARTWLAGIRVDCCLASA
jgi:hypothetical protein